MFDKRAAVFILWIVLSLLGVVGLIIYSNKPGSTGTVQQKWPPLTRLPFVKGKPNLYVFLHPECSCSNATLTELEKLIVVTQNKSHIQVIFYKFRAGADFNSLEKKAQHIVGHNIIFDEQNHEAKLFGAETSGQTYLYDEEGALVFSGGITRSRPHEGDNQGSESIAHWLNNRQSLLTHTPVFGCELQGNSSNGAEL